MITLHTFVTFLQRSDTACISASISMHYLVCGKKAAPTSPRRWFPLCMCAAGTAAAANRV